jgi:hypothetical protein
MYGWLELDGRHGTAAYAQAQCGLCAHYGRAFRTRTRLLAGSDPSLLVMLLEGLAPEPPRQTRVRCPLAFGITRRRAVDLTWAPLAAAAELQVVLAGEKLFDDRLDQDGAFTRLAAALLKKDLARAEAALLGRGFPLAALRATLRRQAAIERDAEADLDRFADPTASGLGLIFSWLAELLALAPEEVRAVGRCGELLGRTLYLVDALQDFVGDRAKGRFNPIHAALGELSPRRLGYLVARFEGLLGAFEAAFTALPLRRHEAVLRASILGTLGAKGRLALAGLGAPAASRAASDLLPEPVP